MAQAVKAGPVTREVPAAAMRLKVFVPVLATFSSNTMEQKPKEKNLNLSAATSWSKLS